MRGQARSERPGPSSSPSRAAATDTSVRRVEGASGSSSGLRGGARSESVGPSSVQQATATATGGGRARGEGARPTSIPAGVGLTPASSDGGGGRGESAAQSTVPSGAPGVVQTNEISKTCCAIVVQTNEISKNIRAIYL